MRLQTLFTLLATALLAGCATTKMDTPSGANEVTIAAPLPRVKTELANVMVNRGYTITRSDDLLIEGERDAGAGAAMLFGTASNPYVLTRVRANLVAQGDTVRLIVRAWMVDGHHSESPLAPNAKSQAWLEQVKQSCEAK